jgi:hypothetical protein
MTSGHSFFLYGIALRKGKIRRATSERIQVNTIRLCFRNRGTSSPLAKGPEHSRAKLGHHLFICFGAKPMQGPLRRPETEINLALGARSQQPSSDFALGDSNTSAHQGQ